MVEPEQKCINPDQNRKVQVSIAWWNQNRSPLIQNRKVQVSIAWWDQNRSALILNRTEK